MSTPRLFKLASSSVIYANRDLLNFIKAKTAQAGDEVKPADNIYFFKDVNFKRDLLTVSQERFSRVIKMEKANVVVVNTQATIPSTGYYLKGSKIYKPGDPEVALQYDDVVFNVSQYGTEYMTTMKQWFELSQLTNQPRVVHEQDLLKFINSGIVINEENYEGIAELMKSDMAIAAKVIDTCKIEDSLLFVLAMVWFERGFATRNDQLFGSLDTARRFLNNISCGNAIPDKYINDILKIEFLKDRITANETNRLTQRINAETGPFKKFMENLNIDFGWKVQ